LVSRETRSQATGNSVNGSSAAGALEQAVMASKAPADANAAKARLRVTRICSLPRSNFPASRVHGRARNGFRYFEISYRLFDVLARCVVLINRYIHLGDDVVAIFDKFRDGVRDWFGNSYECLFDGGERSEEHTSELQS